MAQHEAFPLKLHRILEDKAASQCIKWNVDNQSFKIVNAEQCEQKVLPRFFRTGRMTSFARNLNIYGFRKMVKGDFVGSYYHADFKRNHIEQITEMKRHNKNSQSPPLKKKGQQETDDDSAPRKGTKRKKNAQPENEGDSHFFTENDGFTESDNNEGLSRYPSELSRQGSAGHSRPSLVMKEAPASYGMNDDRISSGRGWKDYSGSFSNDPGLNPISPFTPAFGANGQPINGNPSVESPRLDMSAIFRTGSTPAGGAGGVGTPLNVLGTPSMNGLDDFIAPVNPSRSDGNDGRDTTSPVLMEAPPPFKPSSN